MTDVSEPTVEAPPHTNGILSSSGVDSMDEEERARIRPADIDADVREMERRKRVELIMNSRMFREELERIIELQLRDGGALMAPSSGLLMQQITDMMGGGAKSMASATGLPSYMMRTNCVVPINDIRGVEAVSYEKGEKILRCKLAALFRLIDLSGWGAGQLVTARLNQDQEHFLVNPDGILFSEVTASSLIKADMQGNVVEQGTTNFPVNVTAFSLHAAVHAARPDIKCVIGVNTVGVVAVSALKQGILALSRESAVIGEVSTHSYNGCAVLDADEMDKLARNLGPFNKILLLANQGAVCCGETLEEAFFNARNTVAACESQLKLLPVGMENLTLLSDEVCKKMYEQAHKPPECSGGVGTDTTKRPVEKKWRVGGADFEALMRMLDNAGFRTGYIYRHPLVRTDPPRPKNDVEVPPAVSSLGYLLEEEELYRQGVWKKCDGRKGFERTRWLNTPNVYQKVEILETGTTDPKKITKWVSDGSPAHSCAPVKIDAAHQFVPIGTTSKEFKFRQQQIKDYRRADKISAGPQSHILEGVSWEEAKKMQDATVTHTGDQVVLMGAASKGIIQRGHQHNALVYKSPYAKNPFDSVTDEDLDEYKKVVERKTKGEYDTDYSESEGLSSCNLEKRFHVRSPTSETEEESRDEHRVLRIETKHAPKPSQPEVVLSDGSEDEQPMSKQARTVPSGRRYENPIMPYGFYRTNSFGGLPRGSYLTHKPQHYHLFDTTFDGPEKTVFLGGMTTKLTAHNHRHSHYYSSYPHQHDVFRQYLNSPRTQTVTISVGNTQTVSLGMPLSTLNDFIMPFARALRILNLDASADTVDKAVNTTNFVDSNNNNKGEVLLDSLELAILQRIDEKLTQQMDLTDNNNQSSDDDQQETSTIKEPYMTEFELLTVDYLRAHYWPVHGCPVFNRHDPILAQYLTKWMHAHRELFSTISTSDEEKEEAINRWRFITMIRIISVLRRDPAMQCRQLAANIDDDVFICHLVDFLTNLLDYFWAQQQKKRSSLEGQLITFKKDESKKSGTETYWMSIAAPTVNDTVDTINSSTPKMQHPTRNVDEIVLPERPSDPNQSTMLYWSSTSRCLSPIVEEGAVSVPIQGLKTVKNSHADKVEDVLAGGDGEHSTTYVSFAPPEINRVISDSVTFKRSITMNSASFVSAHSCQFNVGTQPRPHKKFLPKTESTNAEEEEDNGSNGGGETLSIECSVEEPGTDIEEDTEGDWMGYEAARF